VHVQEKADLVRGIDYETVTTFEPPYVQAIKELWSDSGIQVSYFWLVILFFSKKIFEYRCVAMWIYQDLARQMEKHLQWSFRTF